MTARCIAGATSIGFAGGLIAFFLSAASAAETQPTESPASLVARGIVTAGADVVVSTELVAIISSLDFKPGDSFAVGDMLVRFDCARYAAERRAAAAALRTARLEVTSNEKLLRHKAVGEIEVEISRAKRDQRGAQLEALLVRERQCAIAAPFDGRVVERHVQLYEMSKPNGPLLRIVNKTLEIDLIVPSLWSRWLQRGALFRFQVEETGAVLDARVVRISAVVDPVSRTLRVTGQFDDPGERVLPGMSGAATFHPPEG